MCRAAFCYVLTVLLAFTFHPRDSASALVPGYHVWTLQVHCTALILVGWLDRQFLADSTDLICQMALLVSTVRTDPLFSLISLPPCSATYLPARIGTGTFPISILPAAN